MLRYPRHTQFSVKDRLRLSASAEAGWVRHDLVRLLLVIFLLFAAMPVQAGEVTPVPSSQSASGQPANFDVAQPTGLLVKLKMDGAQDPTGRRLPQALAQLAQDQDMVLARVWPALGVGLLHPQTASPGLKQEMDLTARRQALVQEPAVVYAEFDAPVFAADLSFGAQTPDTTSQDVVFLPDDPRRSEQYALDRIFAYSGWSLNQGSGEMVIAVVDSGYDLDHEDLAESSVWHNPGEITGTVGVDDDGNGYIDDILGWDWVENDGVTNDPYGHGTHVGGVIAASTNNGVGIASVGRNLRVMPLRILDAYGRGSISGLLDALFYAEIKGRMVNLSLVTTTNSATLHAAIQTLANQGILIVAAAGNAGTSVSNYYPAAYAETFTVAATDSSDNVTLFSNYGDAIDIAAPGSFILSTYRDNSYMQINGTSMATPHVSALAGLLLSMRPDLTLSQLTDLIRATADDTNSINYPGRDNFLGDGRIDVEAALLEASAGLVLRAGTNSLLPNQAAGAVQAQAVVAQGGAPSQGTVLSYVLSPQEGVNASAVSAPLRGYALTDVDGMASISVTVPLTQGMYALDVTAGQVTAMLPVFVYASPLTISLTTENQEVSAEDTSLPFALEIRDNDGVLVPVPVQVHLTTNVGLFDNGGQEMTIRIESGRYQGLLTSWSLAELIGGSLLIHADLPATGTSAQIQVPARIFTQYLVNVWANTTSP